jgi:hypothetical protein
MTPPLLILAAGGAAIALLLAMLAWQIRRRNMQYWLGSYLAQASRASFRSRIRQGTPVDVLLCIADHFEPAWGEASAAAADARVADWVHNYPKVLGGFRDSDGRSPRHTFFYPIDQYEERHVDALANLCRAGHGEVEIHLHHDNDTAENLDRTLRQFTSLLSERHGLLGRWPDGRSAYGFVHGNWALDNSRPDGRWCGVDNELPVLKRTGCYADFTLPAAPDASQTRKINSIYYGEGHDHRRKSHNRGVDAGLGPPPKDGLMLIQGPLKLWLPKGSPRPRIENGCIQRGQPPSMERLDQWLRASVHVRTRPDWRFVKLHAHGATEANRRVLLGPPMVAFHQALTDRAARQLGFRFHYVTAREMYNLARAAESGWTGDVPGALNFEISAPTSG